MTLRRNENPPPSLFTPHPLRAATLTPKPQDDLALTPQPLCSLRPTHYSVVVRGGEAGEEMASSIELEKDGDGDTTPGDTSVEHHKDTERPGVIPPPDSEGEDGVD